VERRVKEQGQEIKDVGLEGLQKLWKEAKLNA
jgi:tetrapyrrole methylase family protein/MazG family protein